MSNLWSDVDEDEEITGTVGPTVDGLMEFRACNPDVPASEALDAWLRDSGQDEGTVFDAYNNLLFARRSDWTELTALEVAVMHFAPQAFLAWHVSARKLCSCVAALHGKLGGDDELVHHLYDGAAEAIVDFAEDPAVPWDMILELLGGSRLSVEKGELVVNSCARLNLRRLLMKFPDDRQGLPYLQSFIVEGIDAFDAAVAGV